MGLDAEGVARARRPLSEASTLPAEAFTSPELYQRETEQLFSREWLCAGRVDQVPEPGDYMALDLLGDLLVVVRGKDGVVRVLSRVCRHRAAELVQGAGNARSFQCPYHRWTFQLDGQLIGAPHMDGADFDRTGCRLPEIRSEIWEGWIFVNFDDNAEPLGPRLAPLSALLAPYRMADLVAVETATFDSPFNWKVLTDNFMEAYHHIGTHRDTLEPMLPGAHSHTPDSEGLYSVLFMPDVEGNDPAETTAGGLVAATVFPFHLFAPSEHSMAWYQLLPETYDRFTLRVFTCFPREVLDDPAEREGVEGLQAFTRTVHLQDIEACETTWSGLGARSFESGPLCPLEKPIWQFNQWWLDRMTS